MPSAATWMDVEIVILSEGSQTEKDKYHMISLICGIQKKVQINLSIKLEYSYRCRKQTFGYWG